MRFGFIRKSLLEPFDLSLVELGQLGKNSFTSGQKIDPHEPLITFAVILTDKSMALSALHQTDHRVVAFLQEFSQIGDRGPSMICKTGDPEKQLVLLRSEPTRSCRFLTESQKLPQLITKRRKLT